MNIKIIPSSHPLNPLEDQDTVSRFIFCGRHAHLGHPHEYVFGQYNNRDHFIEQGEVDLKKQVKVLAIRPIHMYVHSGITISASLSYPYNDRWDSGTAGFQIVTPKDWKNLMGTKPTNVEEVMDSELKMLDQYLTGDIYDFVITDDDGAEINSMGGFYGSDPKTNGMYEYMTEEQITFYESLNS